MPEEGLPSPGDSTIAAILAIPAFQELVELLKQGAHVVVSLPSSSTHRIYDIRRNSAGNIEYDFEESPEP